ncbi:MAG: DUF4843 domain-containing protein [Prevotella sp.]
MKKNIFIALATLLAMASCSSDEDFFYRDEARIRLVGPEIWTAGSDSLTFSFVTTTAGTSEMAMDVEAQIMGTVADHDRTANIAVVSDKTTATADLYQLPTTVTIAAGQSKATFQVILKRADVLATKSVRLRIAVQPSADFQNGVNEEDHLTFIWNDLISKPKNWAQLEEFFGEYSDTKYRFMLENAGGLTEFDTDTLTWAQLQSYKIMFQNALNDYNAAHPGNPLTDENGNLVSFN